MLGLEAAEAAARRTAMVGSVLAVSSAAAYGINIVFARLCAQMGLTGADMVAYRALLFLPVLAIMLLATGRNFTVPLSDRPVMVRFTASVAISGLCYLSALQYLPVSLAVSIFYTFPLVVMLLSPYVDGVRLSPQRWQVAGVAFAGVLLAVGPALSTMDWRGLVFAGLGSLFSAAVFLNAARLTTDPRVTFFWSQIVAAPVAVMLAFSLDGLSSPITMSAAMGPLAMTFGLFFIAFLMQIAASQRLSAPSAGLLFLFEPVAAIVGAFLILGETVSLVQAIGIAIVIAALAFDLVGAARPLAGAGQ